MRPVTTLCVTLELVGGAELLCDAVAVQTRKSLGPLFGVGQRSERSEDGFGCALLAGPRSTTATTSGL